MLTLGRPRLHLGETDSTNERGRALAAAGAPHGTLVTAGRQSAGRGRQGRTWVDQPGRALLLSLVVRRLDPLLSLRAGLAVADVAGDAARVKWPNDVWLDDRKVAGVLVEGRPQEHWAVIGIGLNVAVDVDALPPELHAVAGSLGRTQEDLEPTLAELLEALEHRLAQAPGEVVTALRGRDALRDRAVRWASGEGVAEGIDDSGALRVRTAAGVVALDSGEVHLDSRTA